MDRKEQIAPRNLFALLFTMRATIAIAFLPVVVSAGRDAWLSTLLAAAATSGVLPLFVWFGIRFPGRNMVQTALDQLGPWVGRLVTLPWLWAFLHLAATVLRDFSEALATAILPGAPLVLLMGAMIAVAAFIVRQGIEVIGRLADLITVIFLFSVVTTLLLALPSMHFDRLTPFLAEGWKPVIAGTASVLAWNLELFVVGMAVAHLPRPRAALGVTLLTLWAATLVVTFAAIAVTATFGPAEAARLLFPVFSLAEQISVAVFFSRIEPLPMLAWGLGLALKLSLLFYAGARGLEDWLGLPRYQPLVLPMGAILLLGAFVLYDDAVQLRTWTTQAAILFPYMATVTLVPAGVLAVAMLIRARRPAASTHPKAA